MKDQFLATLSHELRTPLNAMLGWAHLLETGQLDPDRVQRAVKVIKNSAFAQKQLIEDILDVSRIVNGRMMLNMSSVDIRSIVDGALDTLRPAAEAKQITVMTDIADVPATCGDRDRLQQIVWNLLSNAIKFTPRDGRVDVRVDTLAADVRIVVADNGQGIEPAFLPHIFDRFSQADSSMTRAHGGLGLGMSIVRHLVELHGGTVRAESEGENRGATLTVTLPIRVYREPAERPLPTPRQEAEPDVPWAELPRLDGISVLVVDDELNGRGTRACRRRPRRRDRQRHRDARDRWLRNDAAVAARKRPLRSGCRTDGQGYSRGCCDRPFRRVPKAPAETGECGGPGPHRGGACALPQSIRDA